ncbi:ATP-binding protein [Nonomuraea longicatena]|uniref:histidine kinase n=1 Tax=Nonomuraea longicatena TaxID=83682 RepID=A0ABN1R870_9ACTN
MKATSSVRLRATLAATLVVAAALAAATFVLVTALRGNLESSTQADAARKAVEAARLTGVEGSTIELSPMETVKVWPAETVEVSPVETPAPAEKAEPASSPPARLSFVPAEPVPSPPARTEPKPAKKLSVNDPDVVYMEAGGRLAADWAKTESYSMVGLAVTTDEGMGTLVARSSLTPAREALATLKNVLLPAAPALLVVVAGMTWLSVGRALRPVAAIRAKVADITAHDLHQRVPVPSSADEIAQLATTVNGTLDRLESAVERHKRFVADAAHELRSPIATLRARLELAPGSELTAEALADVERLQALAGDLLLLARLDAGEPIQLADVDLGQVAAEEAVRVERRPEVELRLDIHPDVVVQGVSGHLGRMVTNLVGNAVRHAATAVEVRVHADGSTAVLEVLDDGPGIPPERREDVFDRFTRLDEARARDEGGAGLGLPIARDLAHLHGGTLHAVDGGLVARLPMRE